MTLTQQILEHGLTDPDLLPQVAFSQIDPLQASRLAEEWNRPPHSSFTQRDVWCHALFFDGEPVGLSRAGLLREPFAIGQDRFDRKNTVEVFDLAASNTCLQRVIVRLWREYVFTRLRYPRALHRPAEALSHVVFGRDGWRHLSLERGHEAWLWPPPPKVTSSYIGIPAPALKRRSSE